MQPKKTTRLADSPMFEALESRLLLDSGLLSANVWRGQDFAHAGPGDDHYEYGVEFVVTGPGIVQVTTPWGQTVKSSTYLPSNWKGQDFEDEEDSFSFEAYMQGQERHLSFNWEGLSAPQWAALDSTATALRAASGASVWTGNVDFGGVSAPAQTPAITAPGDGEAGVSLTPTFQWDPWNSPPAGASIGLGLDGPFDQGFWQELPSDATSYAVPQPLMEGAPYDLELNFINSAGKTMGGVQVNVSVGVWADADFVTTGRLPFIADVSQVYYCDSTGREINYDFSTGTADAQGNITIPNAAVTKRPAAEAQTTYLWELIQSDEPVSQVLDTQAGAATLSSWDGGAALGANGQTAAAAPTWKMEAAFTRFDIVKISGCYYEVTVGTGAYDDGLDPHVCADWFSPEGTSQWALGIYMGFENGLTGSEWQSAPVILRNLDPAATSLDLRVESASGTTMKGAYRLNGGTWVSLGQRAVAGGRMAGFPTRFPVVWMSVDQAGGLPDLVCAVGEVSAPETLVPGDTGKTPVTVTNQGDGPAKGAIGIDLYACLHDASQPIGPGDRLVGHLARQTINLGPAAARTFTIPFAVPPDTVPGDYYLVAVADAQDAILELNEGNNVAATDGPGQVVWQFGLVSGRKAVKLRLQDADGTLVTFALTGNSTSTGEVTDEGGLWTLDLRSTTAASTATITATKSKAPTDDGRACLADITVYGSLRTLAAPQTNMAGPVFVDGTLASLTLGDFTAGTVNVGPNLQTVPAKAAVKMKFGIVSDGSVISKLPITSLTATAWGRGSVFPPIIQAPCIGTLTITGNTAWQIPGDLRATVRITDAAKTGIGALKVAGWLDGATIVTAGSMGTLTVGGMRNSTLSVGFTDPVTSLPTQESDFENLAACLTSLTITGMKGEAASFIYSSIVSPKIRTVVLRDVDPTAPSAFGVVADHLAGLTSYTRYAGKTVAKRLTSLKQAGVLDQFSGTDYAVRMI